MYCFLLNNVFWYSCMILFLPASFLTSTCLSNCPSNHIMQYCVGPFILFYHILHSFRLPCYLFNVPISLCMHFLIFLFNYFHVRWNLVWWGRRAWFGLLAFFIFIPLKKCQTYMDKWWQTVYAILIKVIFYQTPCAGLHLTL